MENAFNIVGCKVLGLLRKLVMMPLWQILEKKGHILEMNMFYHQLHVFLKSCEDTDFMLQFMNGHQKPFIDEFVEIDCILEQRPGAKQFPGIIISGHNAAMLSCISIVY